MVNKVRQYFSNLGDKVKTSVRIKPESTFLYLTMILLFVLAILVRISAAIRDQFLIKEFDPWAQFSAVQYILDNGWYDFLHWHDYKMWFPEGADRFGLHPGLLFAASAAYVFLTGLGIPVTPFEVAFYFPAFMGGITVIAMYYFGKEILDERAGLFAAFFLALSPGHMQRTTAGFFDNENIGVFALIVGLFLFAKAMKSGKLLDGVLSGVFIGILALSWGGLAYPFLLLPILVIVLILADKYDANVLIAYTTSLPIGIMIYSMKPQLQGTPYITNMEFIVPLLFFAVLIPYHFIYLQKGTKTFDTIMTTIKWMIVPVAIIALVIYWKKPEWIPFGLAGRFASIINPAIREGFSLVSSVGEHMPSPWSIFYSNTLIALLLVVPGFYFAIRRGNKDDILMIIFVLTLLYLTGSMVRIILILAPAIALMGGYGMANILKYFGNLMQKEQLITRRRKRQLKHTIGRPEGIVVYAFIGILLFVQVNHAIDVASNELGYAELLPGGQFHDWEEALTWMKYNLAGTSVVVSWWDYGYWITIVGNQTSVNDNATWNQTRIGLTGMAMMTTNERYSAEIFRKLGADYVLVFFGHLYSGLGGDEGKWPWMVRICNDNTNAYKEMGLERKDLWYGYDGNNQVNTVFNEADYINSTSGQYEDAWFDSQLVRMMFADEPTSLSSVSSTARPEAYYAAQIEGSSANGIEAKTDDDGDLWSTHIPTNGEYDFTFFQRAFYSSNKLVKVFKVDYAALDASIEFEDTYIDTEGKGFAKIRNSGSLDYEVASLSVKNEALNFTVQNQDTIIKPGESRYVWFDWNEYKNKQLITTDNTYTITINAKTANADSTSSYVSNSSLPKQVVNPLPAKVTIDRSASRIKIFQEGDNEQIAYIAVNNPSDRLIKLDTITYNDVIYNTTGAGESETNKIFNEEHADNFLIAPGSTETFAIFPTIGTSLNLDSDANVTVETIENAIDQTSLAYNVENSKLTILPFELTIKEEDNYLYSYNMSSQSYKKIAAPIGRFYSGYSTDSYVYTNGSLQLTVRNDGNDRIVIQKLYVNDVPVVPIPLAGQDLFLNASESKVIQATLDTKPTLNSQVKVFVVGSQGSILDRMAASDAITLVARNESTSISIIAENSQSAVFANETVKLVIKNTGSQIVDLSSIIINSTTPIALNASHVLNGSLTMSPGQITVINAPISGIKINISDSIKVTVQTTIPTVLDSTIFSAIRATAGEALSFITEYTGLVPATLVKQGKSELRTNTKIAHYAIKDILLNKSLTLDGVYIRKSDANYTLLATSSYKVYNNSEVLTEITDFRFDDPTDQTFQAYYIDITTTDTILAGDIYYVKIVTLEGYESECSLTAV